MLGILILILILGSLGRHRWYRRPPMGGGMWGGPWRRPPMGGGCPGHRPMGGPWDGPFRGGPHHGPRRW